MSQYMSLNLTNQMNSFNWTIDIYNDLVLYIQGIIIIFIILSMIISTNSFWSQSFQHWSMLELIWTTLPVVVLIILGLPSLKMLYLSEIYNFSSMITLKVLGFQWYWEYSFPEFNKMISTYPKLVVNLFRQLESELIILPLLCKIRTLITSQDVLHAWVLPSLGFKMDACPGRLNFIMMMVNSPGKYFGQCSELCGTFHSFMPIQIEFTSCSLFLNWLSIN